MNWLARWWDDLWGMERGMVVSGALIVLLLLATGIAAWAGVLR